MGPKSKEELIDEALEAEDNEDYKKAEELFREAGLVHAADAMRGLVEDGGEE